MWEIQQNFITKLVLESISLFKQKFQIILGILV